MRDTVSHWRVLPEGQITTPKEMYEYAAQEIKGVR